ncbi:F-box/kelch-repeat protein At3g06240-like [Trifolium pratense]|uniref:F-box/kelch-repeat protein At3g06240-like n=1 Tax=Trifolium pratense TaxID=57577 RepID=UPI001E693AD9|nr:F-box/kelch-repeat protein At3g06240-like [Trifolium pratense]
MAAATTYNKVSASEIPNDIAFSILSKLPLKSLKRFTCVQKSWSLLFQNSHFMDMFRTNFISKHDDDDDVNTCLLLKERTLEIGFGYHDALYILSTDRFEDRVKLDWPPFLENDSYIDILGSSSVNGIICIYQDLAYGFKTVLWNPATGEFKIVPPSIQPYGDIEFNLRPDAFGYDNVRDDYKVIRNARYPDSYEGNWYVVPEKDSWYWDGNDDDSFWDILIEGLYDPFWEIYSLKNNSWRKLDVADMPGPWPCTSQLNLNGLCHWLGLEYKVWSFDFTNEKFFGTTLPSYFNFDGIPNTFLSTDLLMLNGCVAFMCQYVDMNSCHIWVLGELGVMESWTKLFVFGPLTCVGHSIGAGKKNDIFVRKDQLARYNFITQKFEEVAVAVNIVQAVIYKEALLPIEGMSD